MPFRNPLRLDAAFHKGARYSAQPEVDRQCHADRASAHDDDLVPFLHSLPPSLVRIEAGRQNISPQAEVSWMEFLAGTPRITPALSPPP